MIMMFTFSRRQQYKQAVLKYLYALLCMRPRPSRSILKDYPGVVVAIDSHFAEQMPPPRSAIFLAAAVLTNDLKELTLEQCLVIRQQLSTLKLSPLYELMIGKAANLSDDVSRCAVMIGTSILVGKQLVDQINITQSDYETFSYRVRGALEGKTADERYSERVSTLLSQLFPHRNSGRG
jgi:hypothetical protein